MNGLKSIRCFWPAVRANRQLLLLLLAALLPAGCAAFGLAAYKLGGPDNVAAQYVPPKTTMLVLVEDYRSPGSRRVEADRIARDLSAELKANKVAPMVGDDVLPRLRDEWGETYRRLTIPAVGQAAHATQVLYVDLQDFSVSPALGSQMIQGKAEARIRIVDVASGLTRWPADEAAGRAASVRVPYSKAETNADIDAVSQKLTQELSDQIAKLFYDSKAKD